ncbi:DUF202 domain-containing protein, partial [Sphaerisporangium sp. NPDC049002]|uniref:YidH family protein n=1 Tax=Sphaerisporangium sp. NPDC049002 TaxID=3155392 RepID=UPI00340AEAF0
MDIEGNEPDPRFTLANERTFLTWLSTSLALSAGGVAMAAVPEAVFIPWVRTALAVVLVLLSALATAATPYPNSGARASGGRGALRRSARCTWRQ